MRNYLPRLVLFGGVVLVAVIGALAFLAGRKLAVHFDPAANESHLSGFMVAVSSVALAVASAFPIFARGVPWAMARLERAGQPLQHFANSHPDPDLGARDGAVFKPAE